MSADIDTCETCGKLLDSDELCVACETEAAQVYEQGEMPADDESLPVFACPHCGESRLDQLVIVEDDEIECATCGESYTIG